MKNSFFIIIILVFSLRMQAQEAEIKDYIDRSGVAVLLYTGKEELRYPSLIRGHPYLDTDQYRDGDLMYAGRLYSGIRLRLNTHTDELTVLSPHYNDIIVSSDLMEYARLPEYTIIYNREFPKNEVKTGNALPSGYYARMATKKYPVYRREVRYPTRSTDGIYVELVFKMQSRLYIYKDGIYHSVRSKGSVLKLFKDKKKELNRYAKQTGLSFGNDRVNAVVALVRYYESITENP